MPRLVFPDDQLVYSLQGNYFTGKPGTKIYIYTDVLGTILADIQDMANATLVGSYVTVNSNSLIPEFQGPNNGADKLYAKPEGGGTIQAIYARVDDRIDAVNTAATALTTRVTSLEADRGNLSYRRWLYPGSL